MKPKFKHDCQKCTFLGHIDNYDHYICGDIFVSRYGNENHEYTSLTVNFAFQGCHAPISYAVNLLLKDFSFKIEVRK